MNQKAAYEFRCLQGYWQEDSEVIRLLDSRVIAGTLGEDHDADGPMRDCTAELNRLAAEVAQLKSDCDEARQQMWDLGRLVGMGEPCGPEQVAEGIWQLRHRIDELTGNTDHYLGETERQPTPLAVLAAENARLRAVLARVEGDGQASSEHPESPDMGTAEVVLHYDPERNKEVSIYWRPEYGVQLYCHGIDGSFRLTDAMLDRIAEWRAGLPGSEPDLPPAWEEAFENRLGSDVWVGEYRAGLYRPCGDHDIRPQPGFHCRIDNANPNREETLIAYTLHPYPTPRAALVAALAACPEARGVPAHLPVAEARAAIAATPTQGPDVFGSMPLPELGGDE